MNAPHGREGDPAPMDQDRARAVQLVVLDVDGVLTDAGIYWTDGLGGDPVGLRRFHVRDGLGIHMLHREGIEVVLVSGKESEAVRRRAREIGIDEVHQVDHRRKLVVVQTLLDRRDLDWSQAACLADDLADLGLMRQVGLPATVADGAGEIRDAAVWTSTHAGGHGAVREFCEALLRARGSWADLVEEYEREITIPWRTSDQS